MKKILISLFLICGAYSYAQESNTVSKCIRAKTLQYLNYINDTDNSSLIVFDFLTGKFTDDISKDGIYSFSNASAHRMNYVMLKNGNAFRIITFKNKISSLEHLVDFFKEANILDKDVSAYLNNIQELITDNKTKILSERLGFDSEWIYCWE